MSKSMSKTIEEQFKEEYQDWDELHPHGITDDNMEVCVYKQEEGPPYNFTKPYNVDELHVQTHTFNTGMSKEEVEVIEVFGENEASLLTKDIANRFLEAVGANYTDIRLMPDMNEFPVVVELDGDWQGMIAPRVRPDDFTYSYK